MNTKRLILAILAVGIVQNVMDWATFEGILGGEMQNNPLFRQDMNIGLLILGDFIFAAIFCLLYARTAGSWGGGAKGGLNYGLYPGLMMALVLWYFNPLMYANYPYRMAWVSGVVAIIEGLAAGAVAGVVYKTE